MLFTGESPLVFSKSLQLFHREDYLLWLGDIKHEDGHEDGQCSGITHDMTSIYLNTFTVG